MEHPVLYRVIFVVSCFFIGVIIDVSMWTANSVYNNGNSEQQDHFTGQWNQTVPRNNTFMDFEAECNISHAVNVLYDRGQPLTQRTVLKLRGCLFLFFQRNPRAGTTAVYTLLHRLSPHLRYESTITKPTDMRNTHKNWVNLINRRTRDRAPIAMSFHHQAEDFISDPIKPAAIFNIMRYPVDHVVSIFKQRKYGDRGKGNTSQPLIGHCNMSLSGYMLQYGVSQSFKTGEIDCFRDNYTGLRYLCGNCPGCSRAVCLVKAKNNIETFYLAVGLSENIAGFLLVMETLLPQFFHGALHEYTRMRGLYEMFTPDTTREEHIPPETLTHLNKLLAPDIELYQYVQQRFYLALKKVIEYQGNHALKDDTFLHVRP